VIPWIIVLLDLLYVAFIFLYSVRFLDPAAPGARIFSLMPPTGSTFPRNVIHLSWPNSALTLRCVKIEANEVNMVIPAEGPSWAQRLQAREHANHIVEIHDDHGQ